MKEEEKNTDYIPGTQEAIDAGCTCPVIDNHYGKGIPEPDGTVHYWYSSSCPTHGEQK
jgi:hypothetical protein